MISKINVLMILKGETEDMNLNWLAKEAHQTAVEHGFWTPEPTFGELVALMHSELSEALEEYRAGRPMVWYSCDVSDACCELGKYHYTVHCCQGCGHRGTKPEGIAVELADCIIRMLDWIYAKWDGRWGDMDLEVEKCARGCTKSVLQRSFGDDVNKLHDLLSAASKNGDNSAIALSYFRWTISYIFNWAEQNQLDMYAIIREKMEYNKTHPYRHGGKRL